MSYEGRVEMLCAVGHRWMEPDGYAGYDDPSKCPFCNTDPVWSHSIDDTNNFDDGHIPESEWQKLLVEPAKTETCNLGHVHVLSEPRYRQPTPQELPDMKVWYNWQTNSFEPRKPRGSKGKA